MDKTSKFIRVTQTPLSDNDIPFLFTELYAANIHPSILYIKHVMNTENNKNIVVICVLLQYSLCYHHRTIRIKINCVRIPAEKKKIFLSFTAVVL